MPDAAETMAPPANQTIEGSAAAAILLMLLASLGAAGLVGAFGLRLLSVTLQEWRVRG